MASPRQSVFGFDYARFAVPFMIVRLTIMKRAAGTPLPRHVRHHDPEAPVVLQPKKVVEVAAHLLAQGVIQAWSSIARIFGGEAP